MATLVDELRQMTEEGLQKLREGPVEEAYQEFVALAKERADQGYDFCNFRHPEFFDENSPFGDLFYQRLEDGYFTDFDSEGGYAYISWATDIKEGLAKGD